VVGKIYILSSIDTNYLTFVDLKASYTNYNLPLGRGSSNILGPRLLSEDVDSLTLFSVPSTYVI